MRREVYPRIYRFPCDVLQAKSLNTCWICVACFILLNLVYYSWIAIKSAAVTQGGVVTQWECVSSSWCSHSPCYSNRKLVLTDICTLCSSCVDRHTALIVSWGEVFYYEHVRQQNNLVPRAFSLASHPAPKPGKTPWERGWVLSKRHVGLGNEIGTLLHVFPYHARAE